MLPALSSPPVRVRQPRTSVKTGKPVRFVAKSTKPSGQDAKSKLLGAEAEAAKRITVAGRRFSAGALVAGTLGLIGAAGAAVAVAGTVASVVLAVLLAGAAVVYAVLGRPNPYSPEQLVKKASKVALNTAISHVRNYAHQRIRSIQQGLKDWRVVAGLGALLAAGAAILLTRKTN
jgi:hypothetical protein